MLKDLNLETLEDLSDTEAELITGGSPTLPLPPPSYIFLPFTILNLSRLSWLSLNPQPDIPG
jgi:hypothetical protein